MKINLNKLKAIILFFSSYTKHLGKVKLMKLIYYLDFTHLKKFGAPVTYDQYFHLEHGPIPSVIKNLIDEAVDHIGHSNLKDVIDIDQVKTNSGKKMFKIVPKRKFSENDKKYFSDTEFEVIKMVAKKFKDCTSSQIEEASHKESPWKETKYLDPIPYQLAAMDSDCKVSEEEIELLLKTL